MMTMITATSAAARDLPIAKPAVSCESLTNTVVTAPGEALARITVAVLVRGGNAVSPYCEVKGYVAPQVNFVLRLPTENWTQRLLFTGCGGFCGQISTRLQAIEQCEPVQNGEFALVSSDLGHSTVTGSDSIWAVNNPQGRIDFGYRGVHVVTVAAKQIIARFYGRAQQYTYFSGCSDGGREAMMEAQRYPNDFNGIVAGAPVVNVTTNNSLYHAWIAQHLLRPDGSKVMKDEDLARLHAAVLDTCAKGGNQPGEVIPDPRNCHFDPQVLLCKEDGAACLNNVQVQAARELYAGAHDAAGHNLYFGLPHGSELSWNTQAESSRLFATSFISYLAGDPPTADLDLWSVEFSKETLQKYSRSGNVLNALDANLKPFQAAGGKLLMWHGWADVGVPSMSSVSYYNSVRAAIGQSTMDNFMRLYMLPGVYHCGNGPGADKIDLLTPLMAWVEEGTPAGAVTAANKLYGKTLRSEKINPFTVTP